MPKFVTSVPIKHPSTNPILAPNTLNATTGRITTYATVILTQFSNPPTCIQIKIFETIRHNLGALKVSPNVWGDKISSFQYTHVCNKDLGGNFLKNYDGF